MKTESKQPLRILLVEDSADDASLILRELAGGGFDVIHTLVSNSDEMRAALEHTTWDVILCDYVLPHFSGDTALLLAKELGHDTPFIFVSGSIGEEIAVAAMKSGAQDYVMKDKLARLVPAIQRELRDARTRREVRRAEASLRASEARFRIFVDHATDAFFLHDARGVVVDANQRACESLGYTREELIGMLPQQFDPGIDPASLDRILSRLDAKEVFAFESQHRRKDGSVFPIEMRIRPFWQEERRFGVALVQDITERKRIEELLIAREKQFRTLAENLPDNVARYDRNGRHIYVNPQFEKLIIASPGQLLGRTLQETYPDGRFDGYEKALRRVIETGGMEEIELVLPDAGQGAPRHHMVRLVAEKNAEGEVVGAITVGRDITERIRTEQRVRQLNRTYAMLSDVNQLIVRERNPQAILDGACRIAVEKGGFPLAWVGLKDAADGCLKPTARAGVTPEILASFDHIQAAAPSRCPVLSQVLETGGYVVCNSDGHDSQPTPWCRKTLHSGFSAMASFALTVTGRIIGTFNLYTSDAGLFSPEELQLLDELAWDIAFALESGERERERLEAVARIRQLAAFPELNPNPVLEFTADGTLNYHNQAAQDLSASFGLSEISAMLPPDTRAIVHTSLATGQPRLRIETAHGPRTLSWSFYPIKAVHAVHCYVGEITDRLRLEEQFRQSQKMEAIGQLAGGVAHDFNNILTAIIMQAELAATTEGVSAETRESLQQIHADADRAANLTRQLLLFSRRQAMQPRDLDLNEVVTDLSKMLQRIIGEDVRQQLHLHPTPLMTRADSGMLDQLLLNLAVNARDAMPDGGHLLIETAEKTVDEAFARQNPDVVPGRYVWLSISDTGTGIPPEVLPRIFDPFFTTKEPGKGTGLGLATVFGIVKQHQGCIKVSSPPGQGANFQVFLPASTATITTADARPKPSGGRETILFTEDEPTVRAVTRTFLCRHGYQVLEAANGAEALKIWEKQRDTVALLLTDLVMPGGMSGQQLARRLLGDNPQLKIILTTGYSAEIVDRQIQLRPGEHFLQKPFTPDHLLETIRRCLDDR